MKIAFAACMDATRVPRQPVWTEILRRRPDVLMLLGDQIYMDWGDLGASRWKRLIERDREKGLAAFAQDMHARYQAQAAIGNFRELTDYLRAGDRKLLMTWDDHDFAWNNGVGTGPDDGKRVPDDVKAISRALFVQFRDHLLRPAENYPALPATFGPPPAQGQPGIDEFGQLQEHDARLPYALLDTRWYRTSRTLGAAACTMLGANQRQRLLAEVAKAEGLLIVATGAPLKYKYLISDQDWASADQGSYPEYAEMLQAARRPVLFLGGDVHRNAWGGRVNLAGHPRSEVVQVLSSGAAIAGIGPKRFPASFGWLDVPLTGLPEGEVKGLLVSFDRDSQTWTQAPLPPLRYDATGWQGTLDGEASSEIALRSGTVVDTLPLSVFTLRNRAPGHEGEDPVSAPLEALSQLDAAYSNDSMAAHPGKFPEPIAVSVGAGRLSCRLAGNLRSGDQRAQEISALMRRTFESALDNSMRSVALFIHGLGKSPSAAIDQGYRFRAAFAACEPMVFSWPTGTGDGFAGAYLGYHDAIEASRHQQVGLGAVLGTFGLLASAPEFSSLTKVIVARSIGSVALGECLRSSDYSHLLRGVHRIVLSAPLIKTQDFLRDRGDTPRFHGLACPIVVTVNQSDQSLKLAKWVNGFDGVLGCEAPQPHRLLAQATYLDFTGSPGVGPLHDYLLPKINGRQSAVNEALMHDKAFEPGQFAAAGLLAPGGSPALWKVR